MAARDAEEVVQVFLGYPEAVRQAGDSVWDRLLADQLVDYCKTGEKVLALFDDALSKVPELKLMIRHFENLGFPIEGSSKMENAIQMLESMRYEFQDRWPWFDQKSVEEGLAAYRRGECLDLDEAFAQAKGLDKTTWLKIVEDHVKAKQSKTAI